MESDNTKNTKGFSLLKLALFLLILIIVSGVVLYAFLDINPFVVLSDGVTGLYNRVFTVSTSEIDTLKETVKTVLTFDENENVHCSAVSNNLAVATVSYVKIIDPDGMEKAYIPVTLKEPFVISYADETLVADLAGQYFALINNNRIAWEKNIDELIVNASISDTWILLITESKQSGYKRTIRAYSRDGQEVSFRNVSNYYPFSVVNYPGYNKAFFAVSSLEASGLEANGIFEILDPAMNQKASIKGENEIIGGCFPLMEERLLIYGEKSIMTIDNAFNTVWEKNYEGYTVTAANAIQNKFPIAALLDNEAFSRDRRYQTTIQIYNNNGTEKTKFDIDAKVTGIATKKKTAAVIAESEVLFINEDGEIMDRYTAKSYISGVYLAKDDLAYVVSSDAISRVKIKVKQKFLGIF
ncbi:MAG TPA: hypothetical protein GXZ22_04680 [Clostridiaceae bacterium]|nr:hypothetical protein [Clostridiaceae bacterium]